jgi:hypothetical protein
MPDQERKPDPEFRSALPCPECGKQLNPMALGSSYVFHCESGHEIALQRLVETQSQSIKDGIEKLLEDWERLARDLEAMAERARKNGHLEPAQIFSRQAQAILSRAQQMRATSRRELQ